jgi:hypothetical protein
MPGFMGVAVLIGGDALEALDHGLTPTWPAWVLPSATRWPAFSADAFVSWG